MDTRVYRRSGRWLSWLMLAIAPPFSVLCVVWRLRQGGPVEAFFDVSLTSMFALSLVIACIHDLTTPYARVSESEITFYGQRRPYVVPWVRVREFSPWGKGDLWYLWLHDAPPVEVRVSGVPAQDRDQLRSDIQRHVGFAITA